MGHADKLRSTVKGGGDAGANSREDASAPLHNDSVRNLAYVVNSVPRRPNQPRPTASS